MQTLCCANTLDDGLLQVTPLDVRLVDAGTGALVHQWKAPAGLQINTASASATQVRPASFVLKHSHQAERASMRMCTLPTQRAYPRSSRPLSLSRCT